MSLAESLTPSTHAPIRFDASPRRRTHHRPTLRNRPPETVLCTSRAHPIPVLIISQPSRTRQPSSNHVPGVGFEPTLPCGKGGSRPLAAVQSMQRSPVHSVACDLDLPSAPSVQCTPVVRRVVQFCAHRVHTGLQLRSAMRCDGPVGTSRFTSRLAGRTLTSVRLPATRPRFQLSCSRSRSQNPSSGAGREAISPRSPVGGRA